MRDLLSCLNFLLYMMLPVAAVAAQESFSRSLASTDLLLDISVTLLLSSLSGLAALLSAMKSEYKLQGRIDRIWLFVSSKMTGSMVAGVGMYFGAEQYGLSRSGTAGVIILAAFSGTVALEGICKWVISKYLPEKS